LLKNNISKNIVYLFFSIFFIIGVFTFKDYGLTGDEVFERQTGFYWLNYVLGFTPFDNIKSIAAIKFEEIKGFTLPKTENNPFYGVIFSLPAAFLEVIFNIEDSKNYYHLYHFLNFTLFFIASIFFYKLLLNRFLNSNIALVGTLFFVLSPRIYASSFYNNKDLVFLSLATIALYYCFKSLEKINYKNLLIFSVFAAMCTSSRIFGVIFPVFFSIFYFLSFSSNTKIIKNLKFIGFFLISYLLFLLVFWPELWSNPIENLFLSFKYFKFFDGFNIQMFFNGEYINSSFLPYSYIFTWILITTPILYILLFLIGYFVIFRRFFLRFINIKENSYYPDFWRGINEKKDLFILLNLTGVIFALIVFSIILYTGWRQIYFLNIFIIYIATYGFYYLQIKLKSKFNRNAQYGVVGVFLIFVIYKMVIFHPYQNLYFGSLFKKNIHNKFEVDYWGLSGKRLLESVLILDKNKNLIKVGVASFIPLERSLKLLNKEDREKIIIVGQDYDKADYIYTVFISEVDINGNDKYKIPSNFIKIDEFILDNIRIYELFKKI
jgi:hypothetical protein